MLQQEQQQILQAKQQQRLYFEQQQRLQQEQHQQRLQAEQQLFEQQKFQLEQQQRLQDEQEQIKATKEKQENDSNEDLNTKEPYISSEIAEMLHTSLKEKELKNVLGIINTSTNAANKSAFKWNKPSTTEVVETQKNINTDSIVFKKKSLLEIQMEEKIVRDRARNNYSNFKSNERKCGEYRFWWSCDVERNV
jgi:hypothetical protein